MADLLIEIYSEHIPARMQLQAARQWNEGMRLALQKHHIVANEVASFVTPRRLTLLVEGLPKKREGRLEERRGPRVQAPIEAVEAFARSCGLAVEELERRVTEKGEFYFFSQFVAAEQLDMTLPSLIMESLEAIHWPKTMHWNTGVYWVRPLHGLMVLYEGARLPMEWAGLSSTDTTYGHAMMTQSHRFPVRSFAEYHETLRQHGVILEHEQRAEIIRRDSQSMARQHELRCKEDAALIEELAGLTEWPVVLLGRIPQAAMALPAEVLMTSMRAHQHYLALEDMQGQLAPYFLMVADITTTGDMSKVIVGNERVLRARLTDAQFFWDQDRRYGLLAMREDLKSVTFHAQLGSMHDKSERLVAAATLLAFWVPHAHLKSVERAALLCKADLVSSMVGEFPELQGIMGSYYAQALGEVAEVSQAIREHYAPLGAHGALPSTATATALALADRLDSVVGLWVMGEKPTGSKDPYALRRAAIAVLRMMIDGGLRIPLRLVLDKMLSFYGQMGRGSWPKLSSKDRLRLVNELLGFFHDRLRAMLREKGVRPDVLQASFEHESLDDDMVRLRHKSLALQEYLERPDSEAMLRPVKRLLRLLEGEVGKWPLMMRRHASEKHLRLREEFVLYERLQLQRPVLESCLATESYGDFLLAMEALSEPLEQFLDHVVVQCDDRQLQKNRLCLLLEIQELLTAVWHVSAITMEGVA